MNHGFLGCCCNELPFLKEVLPFLYKYFTQIVIVDFDIFRDDNSNDGSIEFIKNFPDNENKIILVTDFKEKRDSITEYYGSSMIDKQKMFSYGSKFVDDSVEIIWSTDFDELFNRSLINKAEEAFKNDPNLICVDCSWKTFIYNQYNQIPYRDDFPFPPRIARHKKGRVYGHCNWRTYGKTIKLKDEIIYHFSYVGYNRCRNKLILYNQRTTSKHLQDDWCENYLKLLKKGEKYVNIIHPGSQDKALKYHGSYPEEINVNKIVNELNKIK